MASAFREPSMCDHCGNATADTRRCTVQDTKSLCQGCFQDMPEARREDIGDEEWVCQNHFSRKVEVFCKTCKIGYCKDCADDIHKDHDVVCVIELGGAIRRELRELLQKLHVGGERLSQIRLEIDAFIRKMEEPRTHTLAFLKLQEETKRKDQEEITRKENEEVHRIKSTIQQKIMELQKEGDAKVDKVKERARIDRQMIGETNQRWITPCLKAEEATKLKIQLMENKFLLNQQACECAKKQINMLLEATPKHLVHNGPELSSLVKTSSGFQCEKDVMKWCREFEFDLPPLPNKYRDGVLLFAKFLKYVLFVFVTLYYANIVRAWIQDGCTPLNHGSYYDPCFKFSSELVAVEFTNCRCIYMIYISFLKKILVRPMVYKIHKCYMFLTLFHTASMLSYPSRLKQSFYIKEMLIKWTEVVIVIVLFELHTYSLLLALNYGLSPPLFPSAYKTYSETIIFVASILESLFFCCVMYIFIQQHKADDEKFVICMKYLGRFEVLKCGRTVNN